MLFRSTAQIFDINFKWKRNREDGFLIGKTSGFFKKEKDKKQTNNKEVLHNIKLFTHNTADALYIEPVNALGLDFNGVITLQYAIKRAIEQLFQIESSELGVNLMGNDKHPNIFIYESAEGSLGVLSQIVEDSSIFNKIIIEAIEICRFHDQNDNRPASYDDLLSYYNQSHHDKINRFLIKDALDKLKISSVEILSSNDYLKIGRASCRERV